MDIHERLRRFLPESMQSPIEAASFAELLKIAKEKGVKGFIAIQTTPSTVGTDEAVMIEYSTYYTFDTRKGRVVEFEEVDGHMPQQETAELDEMDELRALATATERVGFLGKHGLLARVLDGWVSGTGNKSFMPHPMDIDYLNHQLDHAHEKGIEPFALPQATV